MADLEEHIERGLEKSKTSKRRKKIFEDGSLFKATWIIPILKQACDEFNQKLSMDSWTKKDKGCANNFIRYCEEEEWNPRQILKDIVKYWPNLMEASLIDHMSQKTIVFPDQVDFSFFFKHRKEIMTWIKYEAGDLREDKELPVEDLRGKGYQILEEAARKIEKGE